MSPRHLLLIAAGLAACVVITFWRVGEAQFLSYDDPLYVTNNTELAKGLTWGTVKWAFGGVNTSNWHPLTTLSYLIDFELFGLNPKPYHINNLILHTVATVLLFLVLADMTRAPWRSAMVAAMFGWHPLHVQSVAWVSERKDVLSAVFCMLTIGAYVAYVRGPAVWRYLVMLALFACGLMSKPMLVTLPPALLLLDFWPLGRMRFFGLRAAARGQMSVVGWRTLLLEKVPLMVLAIGSSIVTFIIQRESGAAASLERLPVDLRIANAIWAYAAYLWKMIWPAKLSVFYPLTGNLSGWQLAALFLAVVTLVVLLLARRRPYLAVGWFWYLGMLVPVIGFVQVGDQAMADRYTYLPLIGPFIMIAWGVTDWVQQRQWRRQKEVLAAVSALLLAALLVRTWIEVGYWKDTVTLFTRAAAVVPRNARAHLALGSYALRQHDFREALDKLAKSVEFDPQFAEGWGRYGMALIATGQRDKAGDAFAEAVRLIDDVSTRREKQNDVRYRDATYNLGLVRFGQGRFDEAEAMFRKHLEANTASAKAWTNLAEVHLKRDRPDDAASAAQQALSHDPSFVPARFQLAQAHLERGRLDDAVGEFKTLAGGNAFALESQVKLAEIARRRGELDDAVGYLRAALERSGADPGIHAKLALVLREQGNFRDAVAHYRTATELNPKSSAKNNLAWLLATSPDAEIRDGAEAVRLAESFALDRGRDAPTLDTLAAAYAEAGDFERAIKTAEQGIAAAGSDTALANELRQRLELYKQHKAYRDEIK